MLTNNAQLSAPGLPTVKASVSVVVVGSFTVSVGVYNEAGELIDTIKVTRMTQAVMSLQLPVSVITGLNEAVTLYFGGSVLGTWNGNDQSGTPVSNGVYHIQVLSQDNMGVVTTVTQQVVVSRSLAQITVNIYNEAGEIVRHLYGLVENPTNSQMTDLVLSMDVFNPMTSSVVTDQLQLVIMTVNASPTTLIWDGRNDNGGVVTSGKYFVEAHLVEGNGGSQTITKTVTVQVTGTPGGLVKVEPNLLAGTEKTAVFLSPGRGDVTIQVRVYDLSGQLVKVNLGRPGSGTTAWDATGVASGMYLAEAEVVDNAGHQLGRQILKLVVIH
jgi:flagellar hook assembly protein FlgD